MLVQVNVNVPGIGVVLAGSIAPILKDAGLNWSASAPFHLESVA